MPLQIIRQDITKMQVDAIVNTTNEEMIGYSGVDLAIHTLAGPGLDEECARIAPLGLGQAKITRGYRLPCTYVIHTSGPKWRGGLVGESIILRSCYIECLKLAVSHGCRTVAFPLISSGVYCYPKDQVLRFAIQTITEFLFDYELNVYLCVYDRDSYTFSRKLFSEIKAYIDDEYVEDHDGDYYDNFDEYESPSASVDISERTPLVCSAAPPSPRRERSNKDKSGAIGGIPCEKLALKKAKLSSVADKTLEEYMRSMDKSFAYKLFDLIDERGMSDVECYKKANVDKRTFSKIRSNPSTYKPSKQTAVAFAIALRLDLDQTQELLESAGLTLSRSFVFDKIIRYFIQKEIYDIFVINEALFEFDQPLLGAI